MHLAGLLPARSARSMASKARKIALSCLLAVCVFIGAPQKGSSEPTVSSLLEIPKTLPPPSTEDGKYYLPLRQTPLSEGKFVNSTGNSDSASKTSEKSEISVHTDGPLVELTLDPELQARLSTWVKHNGNHISALVVASAKTGEILALIQGEHPDDWDSPYHSALYPNFPAASLFKTVATTIAMDTLEIPPSELFGLRGGCGEVNRRGVWLYDQKPTKNFRMNLHRAYALSCNGFYAQLGVRKLGLGPIIDLSYRYGWETDIPTDFSVPISYLDAPSAKSASVATVGRFAAGFGYVGISAVHSAWQMLAIANDGVPLPLRITKSIEPRMPPIGPIMKESTAVALRRVMQATVKNGTATYAFRKRRYRQIFRQAGGKTGTLTGKYPAGLTTWFAGLMPTENPEVVVSAVAVVSDRWIYKGPHLAAVALDTWRKIQSDRLKIAQKKQKTKTKKKSKQ